MIDMHSHILPNMDDGSKSPEMSVEMLKESSAQGVTTVLSTSHFYIKGDSVHSFLERRAHAIDKLEKALEGQENIPDIYYGAEVYYFNGISDYEGIERLSINNTKYILLEMPFNKWNSRVFQEVENIIYNRKLIPVIAHLERFTGFQKGTDNIERLLSMRVVAQMNGEHLLSMFTKGKALKWLSDGTVKLLGSDMHNTDSRPQTLGRAAEIISKKLGARVLDDIEKRSKEILGID